MKAKKPKHPLDDPRFVISPLAARNVHSARSALGMRGAPKNTFAHVGDVIADDDTIESSVFKVLSKPGADK